jgi:hypothetical protein
LAGAKLRRSINENAENVPNRVTMASTGKNPSPRAQELLSWIEERSGNKKGRMRRGRGFF